MYFFLLYVRGILPACTAVCSACGSQKRALDPLELEFWVVESCQGGAGLPFIVEPSLQPLHLPFVTQGLRAGVKDLFSVT